jgi:poly(A) polymerase
MRRHAGELARCAPARVLEEIFKILRCGGSARAFELLRASGALPVILPSLAVALEGWDERGRRAFYAHLSALDRLVRSGEDVSDAVLLGAIVMHLGGPAIAAPDSDATGDHAGPERGHDTADALLASLVQTSRLPRKIAERTRLALHALRTFREPSKKRRRRGRGLAGQSYFQDAVQLLEISVAATGEGQEVLERWRASAGGPPPREEHEERRPRPERGPERGQERGQERRRGPAAAPAHTEGSAREVVASAGAGDATETPSVEVAAGGEGGPRTGAEGTPEAAEGSRRRRRHRGGKRRRRRGAGAPAPAGS